MSRVLKGTPYYPKLEKTTLGDFLFNSLDKYKEEICQIDADLDKSETYGSVKERSVRLALQLKKLGICSKDVVSICCINSLDVVVAINGSFFLGAKIAALDVNLSPRITKHLLSLVTPKLIFVDEEALDVIEKCLDDTKLNTRIIVLGKSTKYTSFDDLMATSNFDRFFKPTEVNIRDIVVMIFSSGTTGLPKAICHSHYSILQAVESSIQKNTGAGCYLCFSSFYWISGMLFFLRLFAFGGTRVFANVLEGEKTFQFIEKYKVCVMFAAPIAVTELTKVPNPNQYNTSSLRYLTTGGTPISTQQQKKVAVALPHAKIITTYGMSEAGAITNFHIEHDEKILNTKFGSCGKAVPGTSIKIVDPDTEEVLGAKQTGEIRVKSPSLMTGYYKVKDCDAFDSEGYLKTGDIGYFDEDECIFIVGRIKEMFKYLSWHIVPSVIEAVLLEHPFVQEAVVFGIPQGDDEVGEIPAAAIVLKENCKVDEKEIEQFVAGRVSDKERLRGGVVFVEKLPRTPTGKLIRDESKNILIKSM